MNDLTYSTFLFARASASEGVARLFDFGNTLQEYNSCESGEEADEIALTLDYRAIAHDLNKVIQERANDAKEKAT